MSIMNGKHAYLSLLARFLLSLLFLYSGIGKLMTPEATIAYIGKAGLPFPPAAYAVALVIELGFALALALGYRTAFVAIVMSIFTLMADLAFHASFAEKMQVISFLKDIAICGGLLQIIASGPGWFSIDARQKQSRTK